MVAGMSGLHCQRERPDGFALVVGYPYCNDAHMIETGERKREKEHWEQQRKGGNGQSTADKGGKLTQRRTGMLSLFCCDANVRTTGASQAAVIENAAPEMCSSTRR